MVPRQDDRVRELTWGRRAVAFFFLIWFLYPETAGRTLEEMDELFINNPGWIIKKEFRRRVRSGKVSPEDDIEKPVASHRDLSTGDSNEKEKA